MRLSVLAAAICLSVTAICATPYAAAAIRKSTIIPAQDLGAALVKLEKERNLQVIFISEDVRKLKTQGASGGSERTLYRRLTIDSLNLSLSKRMRGCCRTHAAP